MKLKGRDSESPGLGRTGTYVGVIGAVRVMMNCTCSEILTNRYLILSAGQDDVSRGYSQNVRPCQGLCAA